MYKLTSPLKPAELELLRPLKPEVQVDEEGLTYATFTSPESLELAQTLVAAHRFGVTPA